MVGGKILGSLGMCQAEHARESGGWKSHVRCSGTSILCGCHSFLFRGAPVCYLAKKIYVFVPVFELGTVYLESVVLYYGSVQMGGVCVRYYEKINNGRNFIRHLFFLRFKDRPPQLFYLLQGSVILEKQNGSQVIHIFPHFYGTWRLITAFTSAQCLSLS